MKLITELLAEELRERIPDIECSLHLSCPPLGRPRLYIPGEAIIPGSLYLTDVASEDFCRGGICTIYANGIQPLRAPSSYICSSEKLSTLFNAVQEIYDRYDEWEKQLKLVLLQQAGMQALLYAARSVLSNPIYVMGNDFSLLAQHGEDELPEDRRLFDSNSTFDVLTSLKQDALFNRMSQKKEPFLYPDHITGWRSWTCTIIRDELPSQLIMLVEHNKKLRPVDGWLLSQLVTCIDYQIQHEHLDYSTDNRLQSLLLRVLSDRTADYLDISRQLSRMRWNTSDEYFCLILRQIQSDGNNLSVNMIRTQLKKRFPDSCSCIFHDEIVTYFNITRLSKTLDEIMVEMKLFIRECLLRAGYSRVMQGHMYLHMQYVQAKAALDHGNQVNPYAWIHHFNDISLRFMLTETTHRLPQVMLCHEKLLQLCNYDAEHNTDYVKTLRTYLDAQLNAVHSAQQLFIHRSTLLYRLSKIKEILESNLDDPDELLYLALSLRLLDIEHV